ncbi:hypothetical protein LEN26_020107 [Aphanomyces euteiches]|nr:hypothetical protein LEN26_020107 [Aphanomyces euteiches]KAH9126419.1 hypothetical protein AeMF1_003152 [Aphanomyces euteiches]KAH9192768.1 hypothetical protein AeNC1_005255 [Aphanomyces euteiches]
MGQTLEIHHEGNATHSFIAGDVRVGLLSGYLYRLKGKPWQRLVLSIPSASRVDRFRQVLSLAAKTPHWTPPPSDVMTSLLQVATEIIESKCALPPPPNPHVRLYSPDRLHLAISTVTVGQVQAHLAEMFAMYEFQGKCTSMAQVYSRLVDLEAAYLANRSAKNFAHTVHRLHPVQYVKSKHRASYPPPVFKSAMEMFSKCPYADCQHDLPVEAMYKSHVKGETISCGQCQRKISPAAFRIAAFIKDAPQFHIKFNLNKTATSITVVTPPVPEDGSIKTFMEELRARMREQAPQANKWGVLDLRYQVYTKVYKHFNQPTLDLVLAMLRQLDFVNKICAHMEYWNNPTVIQASIIRYHKFMHLFKLTKRPAVLVPTSDIDLVWHTHQADDSNYRAFCGTHLFKVIDHDDTIKSESLSGALKRLTDCGSTRLAISTRRICHLALEKRVQKTRSKSHLMTAASSA